MKKGIIAVAILALTIAIGTYVYIDLYPRYLLSQVGYNTKSIDAIVANDLKDIARDLPFSESFEYMANTDKINAENAHYYLVTSSTQLQVEQVEELIPLYIQSGYSIEETQILINQLTYEQNKFLLENEKIRSATILVEVLNTDITIEDALFIAYFDEEIGRRIIDSNINLTHLKQFAELNYTAEQVLDIHDSLSERDFEVISNARYFEELPELVKVESFKLANLARYIWRIRSNPNETYSDVVAYINDDKDYVASNQINWSSYYDVPTVAVPNPSSVLSLVNKQYQLSSSYTPSDLVYLSTTYRVNYQPLRQEASDAFVRFADAARAQGYSIKAGSNYRSYSAQNSIYNSYLNSDGRALADSYSCRPGHSEHQTGLASDLSGGGRSFNYFDQYSGYQWTMDNIHNYGFVQRFPKGKEYITGISFESWHFRYVGVEHATIMKEYGWVLEEYAFIFTEI